MKKLTLKQIKNADAENITNYSAEMCYKLRAAHSLEEVAYSRGAYGVNGALLKDENGDFYKITSRSTSLFCMV